MTDVAMVECITTTIATISVIVRAAAVGSSLVTSGAAAVAGVVFVVAGTAAVPLFHGHTFMKAARTNLLQQQCTIINKHYQNIIDNKYVESIMLFLYIIERAHTSPRPLLRHSPAWPEPNGSAGINGEGPIATDNICGGI